MNSNMDFAQHHALAQRALELGRSNDPACVPELIRLLAMPSAEIRRLAASALAKLADFGADRVAAVAALAPVALRDPHPQVRAKRRGLLELVPAVTQATCRAEIVRPWASVATALCVTSPGKPRLEQVPAVHGAAHDIGYRYDERYRILSGHAIRPDFYLPELDVYVEYWGMDTADYKIGMLKKQQLYQQEGKRLVSIYPSDKPQLDTLLRTKLGFYGYTIGPAKNASASNSESAP